MYRFFDMFLIKYGSKNLMEKKLKTCSNTASQNKRGESTQLADHLAQLAKPRLIDTAVHYSWLSATIPPRQNSSASSGWRANICGWLPSCIALTNAPLVFEGL
jgi:hypothetical protein